MKVITILNWKLLINISDETVFTFKNAVETAESAKPNVPVQTCAFRRQGGAEGIKIAEMI